MIRFKLSKGLAAAVPLCTFLLGYLGVPPPRDARADYYPCQGGYACGFVDLTDLVDCDALHRCSDADHCCKYANRPNTGTWLCCGELVRPVKLPHVYYWYDDPPEIKCLGLDWFPCYEHQECLETLCVNGCFKKPGWLPIVQRLIPYDMNQFCSSAE